jgi:hypothetical protein
LDQLQQQERQAQLVAAGQALAGWIRERRAVWADDPVHRDWSDQGLAIEKAAEALAWAETDSPAEALAWAETESPAEAHAWAETESPAEVLAWAEGESPGAIAPDPGFALPDVSALDAPAPAVSIEPPAVEHVPPAVPAEPVGARVRRALSRVTGVPVSALRGLAAKARPAARWTTRTVAVAAVLAAVVAGIGASRRLAGPYWEERGDYWAKVTDMVAPLLARLEALITPAGVEVAPDAEGTSPVAPDTGQLLVDSEPSGASVSLDGRERGVTPLSLDNLEPGDYRVVIASPEGSVRRVVTVTAGQTTTVSESIFGGWVKVFAPFELQVTAGSRAIRLDDQSQALLPPGPYELQFQNASLGYQETRRIEIRPGETTTLSLVPSPSTLHVTASEPASVLVDGELVGITPLADHPIALGTREIVVRSDAGPERRFRPTVTVSPVVLQVDFSQTP